MPKVTKAPQRIVVFGDVIDDIVATPLEPIRSDTDTKTSIVHRAGGSAANTAAWLGAAGATVDFVGRLGASDHFAHAELLRRAGANPILQADASRPTGTIVIIVDGQTRTMLTERGANAALDPDSIDDELLAGAALVHFTGYSVFGERGTGPIRGLIARATALGVAVSVDPASAAVIIDNGVDEFLDAISGATLLFPNLDEGKVLTGLDAPTLIAAELAKLFPVVALTMGLDGSVVAQTGHRPVKVPASAATAVDPTGAGDAFAAGFIDAWISTGSAVRSAKAAARLSARAVGIVGGRPNS